MTIEKKGDILDRRSAEKGSRQADIEKRGRYHRGPGKRGGEKKDLKKIKKFLQNLLTNGKESGNIEKLSRQTAAVVVLEN